MKYNNLYLICVNMIKMYKVTQLLSKIMSSSFINQFDTTSIVELAKVIMIKKERMLLAIGARKILVLVMPIEITDVIFLTLLSSQNIHSKLMSLKLFTTDESEIYLILDELSALYKKMEKNLNNNSECNTLLNRDYNEYMQNSREIIYQFRNYLDLLNMMIFNGYIVKNHERIKGQCASFRKYLIMVINYLLISHTYNPFDDKYVCIIEVLYPINKLHKKEIYRIHLDEYPPNSEYFISCLRLINNEMQQYSSHIQKKSSFKQNIHMKANKCRGIYVCIISIAMYYVGVDRRCIKTTKLQYDKLIENIMKSYCDKNQPEEPIFFIKTILNFKQLLPQLNSYDHDELNICGHGIVEINIDSRLAEFAISIHRDCIKYKNIKTCDEITQTVLSVTVYNFPSDYFTNLLKTTKSLVSLLSIIHKIKNYNLVDPYIDIYDILKNITMEILDIALIKLLDLDENNNTEYTQLVEIINLMDLTIYNIVYTICLIDQYLVFLKLTTGHETNMNEITSKYTLLKNETNEYVKNRKFSKMLFDTPMLLKKKNFGNILLKSIEHLKNIEPVDDEMFINLDMENRYNKSYLLILGFYNIHIAEKSGIFSENVSEYIIAIKNIFSMKSVNMLAKDHINVLDKIIALFFNKIDGWCFEYIYDNLKAEYSDNLKLEGIYICFLTERETFKTMLMEIGDLQENIYIMKCLKLHYESNTDIYYFEYFKNMIMYLENLYYSTKCTLDNIVDFINVNLKGSGIFKSKTPPKSQKIFMFLKSTFKKYANDKYDKNKEQTIYSWMNTYKSMSIKMFDYVLVRKTIKSMVEGSLVSKNKTILREELITVIYKHFLNTLNFILIFKEFEFPNTNLNFTKLEQLHADMNEQCKEIKIESNILLLVSLLREYYNEETLCYQINYVKKGNSSNYILLNDSNALFIVNLRHIRLFLENIVHKEGIYNIDIYNFFTREMKYLRNISLSSYPQNNIHSKLHKDFIQSYDELIHYLTVYEYLNK